MNKIRLEFTIEVSDDIIKQIIKMAKKGSIGWCDQMEADDMGGLAVCDRITGITRHLTKTNIVNGIKKYMKNNPDMILEWNNGCPQIEEYSITPMTADKIIQFACFGWDIYASVNKEDKSYKGKDC